MPVGVARLHIVASLRPVSFFVLLPSYYFLFCRFLQWNLEPQSL